jgi:signal peptidase I
MYCSRVALGLSLVSLTVASAGCQRKSYKMPSGSMFPSIPAGATIVADTSVNVPARGDVFAFKYPEHPEQSFVKRVVAVPGETVTTKGRTLLVDGRARPTCVVGRHSYAEDNGSKHDGELVLESDGTSRYLLFFEADTAAAGEGGPWKVKAGEYFVMGDNRNNSHDSRMWFGGQGGGVPTTHLQGKIKAPALALPTGAGELEPALAKCKKELGA